MSGVDLYPWALVGAAIAGTYLWRALGVLVGTRIDPDGPLFRWVTCVSYAMLAGLVARMLVMPVGALVETALGHRLAALAVGLALFFALRRHLAAATAGAVATFVALEWAARALT